MKDAEISVVLKYFLTWYEFHLEQRRIKEVAFDSVAKRCMTPVTFSSETKWRPSDTTVNRMQEELLPAARRDMARRALLAELFQRWRNVTLERRNSPPVSRLTDPDVVTSFVRRLQERVMGAPGAENLSAAPSPDRDTRRCRRPAPRSAPISSQCPAPRPPSPQRAGDTAAHPAGGDCGPVATSPAPPSSPGPPPPPGRPQSAGLVDLCSEIMTTHALRLACRQPEPECDSETELRRAPHLHSYLMSAGSNRRQRPAPAAPPPPYQELLQRKAELRSARQQECRRRRQERAAAVRLSERQRHDQLQQRIALERQQQQEQLRQRRLRQEELRQRQLRGQQRHLLADAVRRRALVRRVFRALVRYTQRSGQLQSAAELWARAALLRRCLHRWRHQRALVAAERDQAALHWRRTRLAAWALRRWRRYVHQQRLKAQAAADLSQLQRLQSALRAWRASLALGRVRRRQKMQHAALCDNRLTCAGALRRWRRLGDALERERVVEARKERLRRIVREMVPDFQPAVGSV